MANFLYSFRDLLLKIIDCLHKPFSKYFSIDIFRYACTGCVNTFLDVFLYFITYHFILNKENLYLGFVTISSHIAAFLIVFPFTFISGFLLSKYIAFKNSNLKGRKQLFRYMLTVAGSILLNYILLKFLVEYCHIWPTISKIITVVIVIIYSYLIQTHYTFKRIK